MPHEPRIDSLIAPVANIGDEPQLEQGIALCLSGGGYRAMLFHVGSLWRLHEAGLLTQLQRVSSVSGGSITAGVLALAWPRLVSGEAFHEVVVQPLKALADRTIDVGSVLGGALGPGTVAEKVIGAYKRHLFGEASLQNLPDNPRFVFNASNVQSGALWRFSKPYMADYRVGLVKNPSVLLAVAVAASSAFPPFLSPLRLELSESDFEPRTTEDLHFPPYTTEAVLTDGGVYDNLGLETAWKRYRTLLVSDAGGRMGPDPDPKTDWARHSVRVMEVIDNQVRCLRKRQLLASYVSDGPSHRDGSYWGIRTDIHDYPIADRLLCPHNETMEIASVKTRLARLERRMQERLINWGYAVTDAAIRAHVDPSQPKGHFPLPGGVGP